MYSFKCGKLNKILTCFVMFFSFSLIASAEKNYDEIAPADNLYERCKDSNKCIPICVYSCNEKSLYCETANNSTNNGQYGYVGHYFDSSETDGLKNIWEIGIIPKLTKNYANLYVWTYDKLMVSDNFKYGELKYDSYGHFTFPKDWNNTTAYNKLNNSFICPKYLESNKDNIVSDAFSSEKIKVAFGDTVSSDRTDTGPKELSYSFIDEFENVLKIATPEQSNNFVGPQNLESVYSFMEKAAGYKEYNKSLSDEQNKQQLCKFLKEKTSNNSVEQFVKDFSSDENTVKSIINDRLNSSASQASVRNKNVYTYDNLNSLFEGTRIVDSNNVSYFKKINDIYAILETNAITYMNNECDLGLSENDLQEIQDKTSETVMEKLDSTTHRLNPINYDEEFDCNTLFGGEIAKLISGAYFILEMASLAIIIIFTVIDYTKVILNGESDEIKKQNQKLIKRLIIVAVIFILPALVNTTLRLFHIEGFDSKNPLCVKISNK